MGYMEVKKRDNKVALEFLNNDLVFSYLVDKFIDFFSDIAGQIDESGEDYAGLLRAVYLKSVTIGPNVPVYEDILAVGKDYNDWAFKLSGNVVSLIDTETGVGYNQVAVIGATYDIDSGLLNIMGIAREEVRE